MNEVKAKETDTMLTIDSIAKLKSLLIALSVLVNPKLIK